MSQKKLFQESDLAALAKSFRVKAGRKKVELARTLNVSPPSVQLAEEYPKQSLTKIRIRIIEACSPYEVVGPVYFLKRK